MKDVDLSSGIDDGGRVPRGRLMRLVHHGLRIVGLAVMAVIAAFAGGFLFFYQHVATLPVPESPKADGIVALTGGYQRIDQAVLLLSNGAGRRLLISGVHPSTTANQIRLLTRSTTNLFDCCVDIGHDATDTTGNAAETTRWIKAQNFRSVILVTNNYHMPRSLAELQRIDPQTAYVPYPVPTLLGLADVAQNPLVLRTVASEYVKYLIVLGRDWFDA